MKRIKVLDTTLRDAHQSLWATRMTTAMMLPVAERMDRIGFDAIDLMGFVHFDVSVRYLKENPWERVRLMRQKITRTPLHANVRSKNLTGFDVVPTDTLLLWIELLVKNGVRNIRVFDALGDIDNLVPLLRHAKSLGANTIGALVYGHSPVHTDEFYAQRTRELIAQAQVDSVMIKDGNSSVSCRIFTDFGSCGSGFGDDFSLTVFEFGALKLIEFGFSPVDNRLE